ncbi:Leishmanolysin-like peptidase [Lamellibrachia satsuma]|nr:Leishmanolysin-like peptidase [Lamellibrachia satsuma]
MFFIQVIHTYLGETPHVVKRRSIDQKMRIFVYYDPVSIPALPVAGRNLVRNVLIPEAVTYFGNTLKVRSSSVNVRLFRRCSTHQVYYVRGDVRPYCGSGCMATTKCGSVTVPAGHLMACYKTLNTRRTQEGVDAAGVDTDYILYVSAVTTSACTGNTVAHAGYCQLERALDRSPLHCFGITIKRNLYTTYNEYHWARWRNG